MTTIVQVTVRKHPGSTLELRVGDRYSHSFDKDHIELISEEIAIYPGDVLEIAENVDCFRNHTLINTRIEELEASLAERDKRIAELEADALKYHEQMVELSKHVEAKPSKRK